MRATQVRDLVRRRFHTLCLKLKLRAFGCPYGPGLQANGPVRIRVQQRGSIRLGRNVHIVSRADWGTAYCSVPTSLQTLGAGVIEIGDYSGVAGSFISSRSNVKIGNHVKIGIHCKIVDHDFHSTDTRQRRREVRPEVIRTAPVRLGDDVFVGMESMLLRGVNAGQRVMICAGSVVALKRIPDDAFVGGNPAQVIWIRPAGSG